MSFTVELTFYENKEEIGQSVEIHIGKEELKELCEELLHLSQKEAGDHLHFFSERWGGDDLGVKPHVEQNSVCHHLKINLV